MTDVVEVLGDMRSWVKIQEIDQNKFDLTWRPDPREPPFIYVWGNKFNPVELETALEYHCPGATEIKYMTDVVEVLPETDRWSEVQPVDKSSFDFTWRPDPREPPYIYQFGTQHQKTGGPRYTVPGATDVKYIATLKAVALPDKTNWTIPDNIDVTAFDFSWHPDDTSSENYIYCFSTQWALSGGPRYSEPGALQKKYIETITSIALPSKENWEIPDNIDADTFDFSWHPYTEDDPYIYQFGTQHQKTGGPRYITPGVDENSAIKYIDTRIIKATAVPQNKSPNWVLIDDMIVQDFDFSWHPDDTDDAYIHVFGNQWNPAEVEPTIEYHVQGSTQRKYVNSQIVVLKGDPERFTNTEFIIEFDYSWRPNPKDTEYIHQFGTQWGISGGPRLAAADATEIKYVEYPVSKIKVNKANWVIPSNISTSDFDFSWHPHVEDKPYIYQFGTQWAKTGGPAYIVPGATEVKYIDILKAEMLPNISLWVVPSNLAKDSFDFSWHPDSTDAPFIYQFSTQWALSGGPKLIVGNATEVKYVEYPISRVIPSKEHWTIPDSIDADSFDFSWHPYVEDQPYIYQFGTQWQKTGGPVYNTPGADGISSVKYIDTRIIRSTRLASKKNFTILNNYIIKEFDYSWHPDATDEPYIYQFGNNLYPAEIMPTIEYIVPGATQIKYVNDIIAILDEDKLNWEIPDNIDSHQFDFSWKPNPNDPPYIYQFGTQWQKTGGPRYVVESAIEIKFVDTHIMKAVALANKTLNWVPIIALSDFDYSWYPDATEDPYIYVFGNQWNPAELEPTVEYHVLGATERKYISDIIATSAPYTAGWETITEVADFDYSWRPNPTSPPYVYVFGNTQFPGTIMPTIKLRIGDATQEKFIDTITAKLAQKPELFENTITPGFDYSWRPDPTSPPYIYQFGTILDENDGPRFVVPGNTGEIVNLERTITSEVSIPKYYITTTLEDLAAEHTNELFWALNSEIDYTTFDFTWRPNIEKAKYVHAFGSRESVATQTYFVNGAVWHSGFRDINYLEDGVALTDDYLFKLFKKIDMFFVDKGNAESADRFAQLKIRFPSIQKTRYLNSWVDTINRCINRVTTNLCWILNSELDYSDFDFDYYPSPWQMSLVHVFGTQWSHWGTTFMVNKNSFAEDTKYVKIIEHLSNLNFVKRKVAAATNCLYDAVVVDHGNEATADIVSAIQSKMTTKTVSTIKYTDSYLNTFKELLKILPEKKEHYIWVCSSICDYSSFDFSYICDPFAKEQLHVFPSDKQKFGDTFLVDVNKLRLLVTDMTILEDYKKINYNQHQRVKRLLAPQIITNDDTHVSSAKADFKFPYAVLTTYDNVGLSVVDAEPMSLWAPEHKNIIITSVGGTRIIVPAEAKQYVTKELYDYPYIVSNPRLGKSASMDIIFLSNGEASADTNYDHLLKMTKGLPNRVVRVDGVAGRVNSQQAAATASNTPWYFLVNGKLQVNQKFDWNWQPDRLQVSKHYIFTATNPVNRLEYGHQAIVANNKKLTMNTIVSGLDFTMDSEHEVVNVNCGVAMFNSSEWDTWRTAFREAIKLRASDSAESADRLNTWLTVGTGNFSEYSLQGAKHAVEYYDEVSGDMDKLKLSYDWPWLRSRFDSIYPM